MNQAQRRNDFEALELHFQVVEYIYISNVARESMRRRVKTEVDICGMKLNSSIAADLASLARQDF